jgi:hypothetical protein
MSDRTTTSVAPSAPTATTNDQAARDLLASVELYANASAEQRAAIERDMAGMLADGMTVEDYLSSLASWEGDAGDYLAQLPDANQDDDTTASEEQAPAPTSTLKEANATLAKFGAECRRQADANFQLGALAWDYAQQFLGAAPGRAQRSTAVESLADEWRKWDEESMEESVRAAMERLKKRVNTLLAVHAVATLLGDGSGVAKGNGTGKGRGKGSTAGRISWGTLRELRPLVYREESEHAEKWNVLPSVADAASALVVEIAASGMARKDVVAAVAKLMVVDAELELKAAQESGDPARLKAAEESVERWGGKVERSEGEGEEGESQGKKGATRKGKPAACQDDDEDNDQDGGGECRAKNLLKGPSQAGTARDVASMALELIAGCDAPDTVVAHLLAMLAECKELAPSTRAALKPVAFALAEDDEDTPEDQSEQRRRDAQTALESLKRPMQDDDAEAA